MIRDARGSDAPAIAAIYRHFVENTIVTFEIDPVPGDQMGARIVSVQADGYPWLVWEESGEVIGYAHAGVFRDRAAYASSAEVSIYLDPDSTGRRVGSALYTELLARLRDAGTHLAIAAIALPNPASVALHESLGFTSVGAFSEVGRKFDRWIDVGFWQRRLESTD
jgi:phosphinothricin acetyltransferase